MDLVRYDDPPAVRHSNNASLNSSIDESARINPRTVHFDQINPTFSASSQDSVDLAKPCTVVTARDGETVVVKEHIIERNKHGKPRIRTAPIAGYGMGAWPVLSPPQSGPRTVREKHLQIYIIASIVACVFFFPTGIPALYFAFRTKKEFYTGIETRGEVTEQAIKNSRRCEKLLILTGICLILLAVLIFALVEKVAHDKTAGRTHIISNA